MVFKSRRRDALDLTLLVFLVVSGLQFVAKPFLAVGLGHERTEDYLYSLYGAYSQMFIAFLLIANGVLMLLIIVRDAMAEITLRSETDKLSGLLNRRGFEDKADALLATALRAGVPGAMVLADLDHFKSINDTHGHAAGDQVIASFAQVLAAVADKSAVLGRLGGEEFAVFIAGGNLATARLYAEGVRTGFSGLSLAHLGPNQRVTASFGIAQLKADDSLSDLLRRADAALYEAKKTGRDRVCTIEPEQREERVLPAERRTGSRVI